MDEALAAAAARSRAARDAGKRTSFVWGNFNVVHPGHIRLLKFAAEIADTLIVGVTSDGASGASTPAPLRLEGVQTLSIVDAAFTMRAALPDVLTALRPDFVVKGKEYEAAANPEADIVAAYGGRMVFSSGEAQFSASHLLGRDAAAAGRSGVEKPLRYPARHAFSLDELNHALERMSEMRVLVVGDLIVDDYISCEPLGMSQEDPTIVVTPLKTDTFVGGAGIVAAHAKNLGRSATYLSVVGDDDTAAQARRSLEAQGVDATFFVDATRPTTRKQRYRAHNKTLLRVNHLRQHDAAHDIAEAMLAAARPALDDVDLLLFSDFNYGCLTQHVIDGLTAAAAERGVFMAADSQASSQIGDVTRFKGMDLITPTEREARLSAGDAKSGLARLCEVLVERCGAKHVIITLGADGLLVSAPNDPRMGADRLPALNRQPVDPAGAGDSLLTATAIAMAAGLDIWRASYIGALAAGIQVGRLGNMPISTSDLREVLQA